MGGQREAPADGMRRPPDAAPRPTGQPGKCPLSRVLLGRMENRPRAAAFPLPLMGVSGWAATDMI